MSLRYGKKENGACERDRYRRGENLEAAWKRRKRKRRRREEEELRAPLAFASTVQTHRERK